jgi:hypothetical protein
VRALTLALVELAAKRAAAAEAAVVASSESAVDVDAVDEPVTLPQAVMLKAVIPIMMFFMDVSFILFPPFEVSFYQVLGP